MTARRKASNLKALNRYIKSDGSFGFDPKQPVTEFVQPKSLDIANKLLAQDLDKKLARWFETRVDARVTFRRWRDH